MVHSEGDIFTAFQLHDAKQDISRGKKRSESVQQLHGGKRHKDRIFHSEDEIRISIAWCAKQRIVIHLNVEKRKSCLSVMTSHAAGPF